VKIVVLLAALTSAVAITAAAQAAPSNQVITGTFQDVSFGLPTAACPSGTLFEVDFSLVSPRGGDLGTGISCVRGWDGAPCPDTAPAGCHQTTLATFVFSLAGGSVIAPMELDETVVSGGGVVQHGHGSISGGTGAYAGAGGTIDDSGILSFTAFHLTFVVHLT
jgi:hypothetical protein